MMTVMNNDTESNAVLRQRSTLAPWTYLSAEFHELESELFKSHWMLAGHVSALRSPGDYITFDAVGERALIIVDEQGLVRAFHNVCRHRGARLVTDSGTCNHRISCPFHGWSYGLDGALHGVPLPQTFDALDKARLGLKPLSVEVWHGFVFVCFTEPETSVAEQLQSVADEVAPYQIDNMEPLTPAYEQLRPYNWKVIHDIDNEGYHVPVGHPSLQQLYGQSYNDRIEQGLPISDAVINQKPARLWSVRHYQKLLPHFEHLPEHRQKSWWYIGLFPNAVIALYPEMVEFYMTIPVSVNETIYRGQQFGLADSRRQTRAARYLSSRINGITEAEDESFVRDMQEGMRSSVFPEPVLSSIEAGVQYFHQRVQSALPVARLSDEPAAGTLQALNRQLQSDVADTNQ
jgi:phenylpropionate dioxygenase-like ring-hydroxylating dioxygenase large terminal subunit